MVLFARLLILALTAAATPILRRDASTVENDITQKIGPQITKLNNDVNGFPASGLTGAQTIHNDFQTLATIVAATTDDIKSTGSFSITAGTTILADVQLLVPTLSATLVAIGSQEPSWAAIPGGSELVFSDLQSLKAAFNNFSNALAAASPFLLKAGSIAIQTQMLGAFDTAIATYSVSV
ncbi:hypothetical protein IFM58399_10145 [Aspergillus lentulus]|uniref:cell wall mannoprotein 1 family protein n=1 Tax=Aspergillus lentulus TaxID=293939 RepID=UPI0013927712|nr:uncharacterized protein IFM58399_10145 [Aspergillus lentulus]GFF55730.1 hypothetical protein IFM58399_10145 [Aspergillus lentulus]GFF57813.1 hypothetical protein IFM62136_03573 [Aspergillus lentulus]